MTDTLVLASSNLGKLQEFTSLLAPLGIQIRPQAEWQVSDADETGLSFVENAILKARHAAAATGQPAIADDSGLVVDALNGAPGIYSARYAGSHGNDAANNQKLLEALKTVPREQRTARFVCILAVLRHAHDPLPLICEGYWEGHILTAPQGQGGFGYDPLFGVPQRNCSAAELPAAEKNRLSHRGLATAQLRQRLPQWWTGPTA
jgi:XTP/dITP diphosphohydrolase